MQAETRIHLGIVSWWNVAASGFNVDPRYLHHSPNGGKRGKVEASLFKGMGLRSGFEDLILTIPIRRDGRIEVPGLFIEVKAPKGRISPEQREMMALHQQQGYAVAIAWSVEEGISAIINYLKTGHPLTKK